MGEVLYQMQIDNGRMMFPLFKTVSAYKVVEAAVKRCGIATEMLLVQPHMVANYLALAAAGLPFPPGSDLRDIVDFNMIKEVQIVDLFVADKDSHQ